MLIRLVANYGYNGRPYVFQVYPSIVKGIDYTLESARQDKYIETVKLHRAALISKCLAPIKTNDSIIVRIVNLYQVVLTSIVSGGDVRPSVLKTYDSGDISIRDTILRRSHSSHIETVLLHQFYSNVKMKEVISVHQRRNSNANDKS